MAVENFSGESAEKSSIEEFLCSAELRGQVDSHLIILSVLHSFVFITKVLGKTLILTNLSLQRIFTSSAVQSAVL